MHSEASARSRIRSTVLALFTALAVLGPVVVLAPRTPALAMDDYSTTAATTWQTDGIVHALVSVGDIIYIGGEFTALTDDFGGSVPRNNLAAIDRTTGLPTAFDPDMDRTVFDLVASPDESTLFAGGAFTTAGGLNRRRVASFDIATGSVTAFNPPSPNNVVRSVATDGTRLFFGGFFTAVGGVPRTRIAAYDLATETLDPLWLPTATAGVKSIIIDPDRIWLAGNFSKINSVDARGVAAVDPVDGTLFATDHVPYAMLSMAAQGNQIFLGGAGPGGWMYAMDRTTGALQWSAQANGNVQATVVAGDYVYYGGHYDAVEGESVSRVHRLSTVDGAIDTSWKPSVTGIRGVNRLAIDDNAIYLGGDFTFASGMPQQGFALFEKEAGSTGPQLVSLTMLDTDGNAYVDTVEAVFDEVLAACAAPCTTGWTLDAVPSGGTLASVAVSGATATLSLTEGTGEEDTAVRSFTIALDATSGIESVAAEKATFSPTGPADGAAPVVLKFRKTNIGTTGLAEAGDTIETVWSEPLDPATVPALADVVISDPDEASNDQLSIAGYIDGSLDLGSDDFLLCPPEGCGTGGGGGGGGTPNMNAIMVAGNTTPPSGDRPIRDLLVAEGFSLTIVDDDSDLASLDTSGAGLLVITSSVVPSKVGDVFKDVATPILTWENYLFADLGMTTNESVTAPATAITIADPAHPIADGNAGTVTVLTQASAMSTGNVAGDAQVIAHVPLDPATPVVFAFDEGALLADGTIAAGPRVALFPDYVGGTKLSAIGQGIVAAAANDLVAVDAPPPPPAGPAEVIFADSAVTLTSGNSLLRITLSACTGDCSQLAAGPKTTMTYLPPPSILDVVGNVATGSVTKEFKIF